MQKRTKKERSADKTNRTTNGDKQINYSESVTARTVPPVVPIIK